MIQHTPMPLYTVSGLMGDILVWGFLEILIWVGIIVVSEHRSPAWAARFRRVERVVNSLARRRFLVVAAMFLLVFVGRLSLLRVFPVPPPKIPDEFSGILLGDTFAHWRLTNPTHPMWFYFETMFVNQKPTYSSMYPPGVGLFIAAGQIPTGQPWYGMLLSVALAAAAVCWMLQGWVPPRWALWGGLVFVLLAVKNSLTENYLGEGIVVLGGALVLGAIPRIVKKRSIAASIWLGVGVTLLAITRPYEGVFFVAGIGIGGIYWAWTEGLRTGTLLKRAVVPVAAILVPIFLWAAYLNWRTTGNPLEAPYQLNLAKQHVTRPFYWQEPVSPPPRYEYAAMASFYQQWEMNWWKRTHESLPGFILFLVDKVDVLFWPIVWPLSIAVALGCYQSFKNRRRWFLPFTLFFFALGLSLEAYQLLPKYAAAAWGLVILLAVCGLRYVGAWKRRTRGGLRISRAAVIVLPAALILSTASLRGVASHDMTMHHEEPWWEARQQVLQALGALPGKQLVIVRYSLSHIPYEEWVYNRADIDSAKVVWARDVPERRDADLLQYFRGRTVWLLEPDGKFPRLNLYPGTDAQSMASEVGPFRVACEAHVCEDLRSQLGARIRWGFGIL